MCTLEITFYHAGSTAPNSASISNFVGFGSVTYPSVMCSCGHSHTFTGTVAPDGESASGSGVFPATDPPGSPVEGHQGPKDTAGPSWHGTISC